MTEQKTDTVNEPKTLGEQVCRLPGVAMKARTFVILFPNDSDCWEMIASGSAGALQDMVRALASYVAEIVIQENEQVAVADLKAQGKLN